MGKPSNSHRQTARHWLPQLLLLLSVLAWCWLGSQLTGHAFAGSGSVFFPIISNILPTPVPTPTPGPKSIVVSISQQRVYAYEGDREVYSFPASTGANGGTRTGDFTIQDKLDNAWSDAWGFWMPDWMGIYWVGDMENGFHALPVLPNGQTIWGDQIGTPVTYGCVVLRTEDMRKLYDWAEVGTQVEIRP